MKRKINIKISYFIHKFFNIRLFKDILIFRKSNYLKRIYIFEKLPL